MPRNSRTIIAPVNGLNIGAPGTLIDSRQTPNCLNVEILRSLIRKSRGGTAMGSALGERILSYGELNIEDVTNLVRVGLTKAEEWNGTSWTSIANVPLTGAVTSRVQFAYPEITGSKVMVYTNFEDNIRKYTGTGTDADLGGSPPKCRFVLNYRGYLILAYINDTGTIRRSRVQWSDVGDIENWATGDAGSADLIEDDSSITALAYFGEYVTIHKEKAIYIGYLTGTDNVFRFERKETGSGSISHTPIVNLPTGEQMFLSRDGLRLFNGVTAPDISGTINVELADSMNSEFLFRSWGVHVRELKEAWFGIPIGSSEEPDTIYKYNYATQTIYKDRLTEGITFGSLYTLIADDTWDADTESWDSDTTTWDSSTALALHKRVIFGVGDTGISIQRTDSSDLAGVAIESNWDSKDFTASDLQIDESEGLMLEWQGVEVIAKGTAVSVYYSTDEGTSWTLAKTLTLTSAFPADSSPTIAYFRVVATKCRFRFMNSSLGGVFEIKQFRPMAIPREERQ